MILSENRKLLLGTQSPRRHELMKQAGFHFEIVSIDYEENPNDSNLPAHEIPAHLAVEKSKHFEQGLTGKILLTADTLVLLDGKILGKPRDQTEAFAMIFKLSGRQHHVVTGVCLRTGDENPLIFSDTTMVEFRTFSDEEITYYTTHYPVLDKAGAYGAQDWIGLTGITKLEGSYFNVMGLPVHKVYALMKQKNWIQYEK